MKIAYFDCFSGLSGDMALGALLDCGVPIEKLRDGLSSLPVSGWTLDAQPVLQSGIHALSVSISLHGETDEAELSRVRATEHDHAHEGGHAAGHQHENEHSHAHEHSHDHEHHHNHSPQTAHHHGRSMREIRAIIEASDLSARVKSDALLVFAKIAEAEAFLHHATPDDVHFHEIGGIDSLLDICGVAWCLEYLGVEQVYFSPLPLGSGWVDCAHGKMPVPAPATLRLLQGAPVVPSDVEGELVTPTGAGFVAAFGGLRRWGVVGFDAGIDTKIEPSTFKMPPMVPQQVGHGAGKKRFPDRPNFARVTIGEEIQKERAPFVPAPKWDLRNVEVSEVEAAPDSELAALEVSLDAKSIPDAQTDGLEWRTLELLESNVDDMNPEAWGFVLERVLEAGALDAWIEPLQMKKARPAHKLCALCNRDARDAVLRVMLRETTTLGVRVQSVQRAGIQREIETVVTPYGEARVKVAFWEEGGVSRRVPEWDDVARLARATDTPTHEIYAAVRAAPPELRDG